MMSAFLYGISLQFKLDLRNKNILLTYYIVPLLFFIFMGGIFTSINPTAKQTLIQSMTVFGVTMGAILGLPTSLVEIYSSEIKNAYKVGGIPSWVSTVNNFISAFIHLLIMSTIIFIIAPFTFNAKVPQNMQIYFLSLSIFIMTSLSVGTILGLFVTNASKVTMLSQLVFLPSLMMSGIMFPVELLPKTLEIAGKIFPATWGFKLMINENFNIEYLLPLIIIFIISVLVCRYRLAKFE